MLVHSMYFLVALKLFKDLIRSLEEISFSHYILENNVFW